jgi:hypothetical protein
VESVSEDDWEGMPKLYDYSDVECVVQRESLFSRRILVFKEIFEFSGL